LNNFEPDTTTSYVAHGMLGFTMFATYPLASFVARHVCVVLLFQGRAHEGGDDSSILKRPDRRIFLTLALYILAMIPATIYTDMGQVLALAGVVGGSCLAYVGPGMLYLAVHGGRFLELADDFFFHETNASKNGDRQAPSETTTLVTETNRMDSRAFNGCFKMLLWYLGGMPVWSFIAEIGKARVLAHAQELAAKNTIEYNRIGDVDHSGIEKLIEDRSVRGAPASVPSKFSPEGTAHLIRPRSNPDIKALGNNTFDLETNAVKKQTFVKPKQALPPLEPDPQEAPRTWVDFLIAVFYICFGVVAVFAGLISLGADEGSG